MYAFVVLPERGDKAVQTFVNKARQLTEDQVIDVMYELGWHHLVTFDENGKVNFALSDIQFVGAAAAMAAVVEAGARKAIVE